MQKVILYYKFVNLDDPESVMNDQKRICSSLGLKGRILISNHGINGTLSGTKKNLDSYIKHNNNHKLLNNIFYKWSNGSEDIFPKLSIKVRDEIITFNAKDQLKVDDNGVVGTGEHISPEQLHKLIQEKGDQVVFFDGRNSYESDIGRFKGAVLPAISLTKEFLQETKKPKYNYLKDKILITYCTGGIRCEVLSTILRNNGFKHVYQLEGGIVSYCEKYGDSGLWEGSVYVFDRRMTLDYSNKTKQLGSCHFCGSKTNHYTNCANKVCNLLFLVCKDCSDKKYCLNEKKSATLV